MGTEIYSEDTQRQNTVRQGPLCRRTAEGSISDTGDGIVYCEAGRRGNQRKSLLISGTLSLASLTDAAGHGSDESGPLPAAVL